MKKFNKFFSTSSIMHRKIKASNLKGRKKPVKDNWKRDIALFTPGIGETAGMSIATGLNGLGVGIASPSTLGLAEKMAKLKDGIYTSAYDKKSIGNAKNISTIDAIGDDLTNGILDSKEDLLKDIRNIPEDAKSSLLSGGSALAIKKAAIAHGMDKGKAQTLGFVGSMFVPSMFSDTGEKIDDIIEPVKELGKDVVEDAGGVLGGLGAGVTGATIGGILGHKNTKHYIKEALKKKKTLEVAKKAAKRNIMIGGGRGALIGAGIGTIIGSQLGKEKARDLVASDITENSNGLETRMFVTKPPKIKYLKRTGKILKEIGLDTLKLIKDNKLDLIKLGLIWGVASPLAAYGIDKAITHDAKKTGLMPKNSRLEDLRLYSASKSIFNKRTLALLRKHGRAAKSIMQNFGKDVKDVAVDTIKNHPSELIWPVLFAGGPLLSYAGEKAAYNSTVNNAVKNSKEKQKTYSKASIFKTAGNWIGKKSMDFARATGGLFYDRQPTLEFGKNLEKLGKTRKHKYSKKLGKWISEDGNILKKIALGVGGAHLKFAPMILAADYIASPLKKGIKKVDKDAFEYEEHLNKLIQ